MHFAFCILHFALLLQRIPNKSAQIDGVSFGDAGGFLVAAGLMVHSAAAEVHDLLLFLLLFLLFGLEGIGCDGAFIVCHMRVEKSFQIFNALAALGILVDMLGAFVEVSVFCVCDVIDQLVLLCGNHIASFLAAFVLRVDLRVLAREDVDAVEFGGIVINSEEREERGRNVNEGDGIVSLNAVHSGNAEDEGNAVRGGEHCALADVAVVAEGLAVVGDEEDDGVLVHTLLLERAGDASDLVIHKGDAGVIEILRAADVGIGHIKPCVEIKRGRQEIFQIGSFLGHEGSLGDLAEELVPGRGRAEGRMRMDEGGHQEGRLFGVAIFDEFNRAVTYPLCRMRLCGKLAYLRNVVHIAALTVVVEYVFIW